MWGQPSALRGITERNVLRWLIPSSIWACPTPDGKVLAGSYPEHWEGETNFGALGEFSEEGGSITDSCSKFLPISGPVSASFWGGNMALDVNDAAETGGGTHELLEKGGGDVGT